jgi:hypothetical protein
VQSERKSFEHTGQAAVELFSELNHIITALVAGHLQSQVNGPPGIKIYVLIVSGRTLHGNLKFIRGYPQGHVRRAVRTAFPAFWEMPVHGRRSSLDLYPSRIVISVNALARENDARIAIVYPHYLPRSQEHRIADIASKEFITGLITAGIP